MFCRHCGSQVDNSSDNICPTCGLFTTSGHQFCPNCGAQTTSRDLTCPECTVSLSGLSFGSSPSPSPASSSAEDASFAPIAGRTDSSKSPGDNGFNNFSFQNNTSAQSQSSFGSTDNNANNNEYQTPGSVQRNLGSIVQHIENKTTVPNQAHYQQNSFQNSFNAMTNLHSGSQPRSKLAAGILGICFGMFGVHNFYLGYTTKGIIQLVLGIFTCGSISAVWGFVEGILILTGSINKDANGRPLTD